MQNINNSNQLRNEWIRKNIVQIVFAIIIMLGCYIAAIITHWLVLVIIGIIVGFSLYFIGRNKMITYIEQNETSDCD